MARIRIEDLPPVENLPQEELAEIFGAGLRSFKPSFEALESREVTDVAFGQALLQSVAPPPPAAAQVGQLLSPSVQAPQTSFLLPVGSLQATGSRQPEYHAGDPRIRIATELARTVADQFQREVIDKWRIYGWKQVTGYAVQVTSSSITNSNASVIVQIQFSYGNDRGYVNLEYVDCGGLEADGTVGFTFSEVKHLDMSNFSPHFAMRAEIKRSLPRHADANLIHGLMDEVYSTAVDYFKGQYGDHWKPPVDPGLSAKLGDGKFIIEFRMNGPNGQTDRTFRATFTIARLSVFLCQDITSDAMVPERLKEKLATVWTRWS